MNGILQLAKNDYVKGLLVFVFAAVLNSIQQVLTSGSAFDFKQLGVVALTAGIAYLLKNLGTDNNGQFAGKI